MEIVVWACIGLAGLAAVLSAISIIVINGLFIGQAGSAIYRKLLN
ncbi:MAG: hypothetical protein P8163_19865 [Candidatus Thiodiazotropha sp.]